ncbi:MAG TPA: hypothetical protein VGD17_14290 [Chitinophagaceae bacterium]
MNQKLKALSTEELAFLLNQEHKKFLLAIDYGATGSDLEEIREVIKQLELMISIRKEENMGNKEKQRDKPEKPGRQSVA